MRTSRWGRPPGVAPPCHIISSMVNPPTSSDAVPPAPPVRSPPPKQPDLAHRLRWGWRFATADLRARPSFVILGTQRGGTTSLFRWLATHPDIDPPTKKEVHYFDALYDQGPRWYRSHFPITRHGHITGEGSPYMLFHPLAPARAARDLPESTKFVILLREPVQRTISHYWFSRRRRRFETEPIERALALEPERLAGQTERVLRGENSDEHSGYSYVSRSEYAGQVRRWFDAVGRDRILIVESEQMYTDPAVSAAIVEWIGLTPHDDPFPTVNESVRLDTESPELLAQLAAHFEPHNQELFELLGYELWTGSTE